MKVLVALPSTSEHTHVAVTKALFELAAAGTSEGHTFVFFTATTTPYLDVNRNLSIHAALRQDVDGLLFLDPSIAFTANAVLSLLTHDEDIVSGAYAIPQTFAEVYDIELCGDYDITRPLIPARYIPMNLVWISKKALVKMANFINDDTHPALFTSHTEGSVYHSSDKAFCDLAKDAGVQIYVDPSVNGAVFRAIGFYGDYQELLLQKWLAESKAAQVSDTEVVIDPDMAIPHE